MVKPPHEFSFVASGAPAFQASLSRSFPLKTCSNFGPCFFALASAALYHSGGIASSFRERDAEVPFQRRAVSGWMTGQVKGVSLQIEHLC